AAPRGSSEPRPGRPTLSWGSALPPPWPNLREVLYHTAYQNRRRREASGDERGKHGIEALKARRRRANPASIDNDESAIGEALHPDGIERRRQRHTRAHLEDGRIDAPAQPEPHHQGFAHALRRGQRLVLPGRVPLLFHFGQPRLGRAVLAGRDLE